MNTDGTGSPTVTPSSARTEEGSRSGASGGDGSRVVLAAIDMSASATNAAWLAAGLARRNNAVLVLVYVRRPPIMWADFATASLDALEVAAEPTPELCSLARVVASELAIDTEVVVRVGSPAQEIARVATERHADLIVAGTSRSFWRRLVASVPARLVRCRAWPVVTVP